MNEHVIALRSVAGSQMESRTARVTDAVPDPVIHDWDLLFRAAIERLAALAADQAIDAPDPRHRDLSGSTRDVMLACVQAFTQLHAAIALEFERCTPAGPGPTPE
jgi:hypothetical protein